ncbi:hypothetical protein KM043_018895 [Ampulex compressa]|nr:hypothetical protein KM043_018895 [Ampulex compressa]
MTRAHVRLLGPCFKTGPESTQSSSVADRSVNPSETSLPTSLNAFELRPITVIKRSIPPSSRTLNRSVCRAEAQQTTDRPLIRHPTGRDVLLGEKCTPTTPDMPRRPRDARPRSRLIASRTEANAADDESPHSIFWVSQVYP